MDVEAILDIIGCKTRRQILHLLTEEPCFVSQISKELDIGQKAIIEHLKVMEEFGILRSSFKKIERGRPRKYYDVSQDIKIQIFISHDSIKMHVLEHEFPELYNIRKEIQMGKREELIEDIKKLIEKYDRAKKYAEELLIEAQKPISHHNEAMQ